MGCVCVCVSVFGHSLTQTRMQGGPVFSQTGLVSGLVLGLYFVYEEVGVSGVCVCVCECV